MVIARRFNGPPQSANGGYACGVVAEGVSGTASARLRVPPPLDTPLSLDGDGDSATLTNGEVVVGEARSAVLEVAIPDAPDAEQAAEAARRYAGLSGHPFATCFVCGPERSPGDGLRIFPGPLESARVVASPWSPDESLLAPDGRVDRRFVWAALDCPSYFAVPGLPRALLAEMTADITRLPEVGEELVVIGWHDHSDGRKHFAGSSIATPEGDRLAAATTLWIEPSGGLPT